jgi:hypothetical protein
MTPFQCELRFFRIVMDLNSMGREPKDAEIFKVTRQANLDAF